MPRGLLRVYAFDKVWKVSPFVHYALLALSNSGARSVRAAIAGPQLEGLEWFSVDILARALESPRDQVCLEYFMGGRK